MATATPNLTPSQAKKLNDIAWRIINGNIGKQFMAEALQRDGRIDKLFRQKAEAIKEMKMLKVQIIERQLEARTNELLFEEAGRRIKDLCKNGDIDAYLSEEDHQKLETCNAQLHLLLDALDSVLTDVSAVYDSCGLTAAELDICVLLKHCRKSLSDWFNYRLCHNTPYEETIRSEGDRLYEHVKSRVPILERKLERIQKKQEKDDGKGRKE